jgi:hypothetical protein
MKHIPFILSILFVIFVGAGVNAQGDMAAGKNMLATKNQTDTSTRVIYVPRPNMPPNMAIIKDSATTVASPHVVYKNTPNSMGGKPENRPY